MTTATHSRAVAEQRWTAQLSDHPSALAVAPDGTLAAASLGGETLLLDPGYGHVRAVLPAHEFGVLSLAWSPDGTRLAVGGADGRLALHDAGGAPTGEAVLGGWVAALAWSRDGALLVAGAGRDVCVVDPDGGERARYRAQPSTVTDLAWSDRRLGVACYGGIRWYEPGRGDRPVKVFEWKGSLLTLRVAPSRRWVASGNQDASIHVWRLWTGEDLEMTGYPSKVTALAWDQTSRWLAAGGAHDVTVWDHGGKGPQGRRPRELKAHQKLISCLSYQHRGALLASGGRDGLVAVWRPTGPSRPLAQIRAASPVSHLAWTADDRDLLVARADGSVACWRAAP